MGMRVTECFSLCAAPPLAFSRTIHLCHQASLSLCSYAFLGNRLLLLGTSQVRAERVLCCSKANLLFGKCCVPVSQRWALSGFLPLLPVAVYLHLVSEVDLGQELPVSSAIGNLHLVLVQTLRPSTITDASPRRGKIFLYLPPCHTMPSPMPCEQEALLPSPAVQSFPS